MNTKVCIKCNEFATNAYDGVMNHFICDKCGWDEVYSDECCKNKNEIYIKFEKSNKAKSLRKACSNCKTVIGSDIKISPNYINEFNHAPILYYETHKERTEMRSQEYKRIYDISKSIRDKKYIEYQEERMQNKEEWDKKHKEYLRSNEWRNLRLLVLKRDNFICQGCLLSTATEVHHMTYKNHTNELAYELISLCSKCHKKEHNII
jgi:5-methylcytosine-specific restriction endonuclease McrA